MKHLPECPCPTMLEDDWYCCQSCNPDVVPPWERDCICDALRACEQRVARKAADEFQKAAVEISNGRYVAGVQAARDAVEVTLLGTLQLTRDRVLAAIDALRNDNV